MNRTEFYKRFLLDECLDENDPAHDLGHIQRVVKTALELANQEGADEEVVEAAAWLHDCVVLPKNHPERNNASLLAAEKAQAFLSDSDFPREKLQNTIHSIEAHSYSGGITPETLEAKLVQDADRLDALGAVGIARCFMVAGQLNRLLYQPGDPFCSTREPDDSLWTVDHFYEKLFKLPGLMNTKSAKKEGVKRVEFMKNYLEELRKEIGLGD